MAKYLKHILSLLLIVLALSSCTKESCCIDETEGIKTHRIEEADQTPSNEAGLAGAPNEEEEDSEISDDDDDEDDDDLEDISDDDDEEDDDETETIKGRK
jgi:hypothetical protein